MAREYKHSGIEWIGEIPNTWGTVPLWRDLSLYQPGNEGVVIGDFGEKARLLFEQERISEGHYVELLNLLK